MMSERLWMLVLVVEPLIVWLWLSRIHRAHVRDLRRNVDFWHRRYLDSQRENGELFDSIASERQQRK